MNPNEKNLEHTVPRLYIPGNKTTRVFRLLIISKLPKNWAVDQFSSKQNKKQHQIIINIKWYILKIEQKNSSFIKERKWAETRLYVITSNTFPTLLNSNRLYFSISFLLIFSLQKPLEKFSDKILKVTKFWICGLFYTKRNNKKDCTCVQKESPRLIY